ncbi:MAG: Mrp/NBP35 family ATP-binding protein [Rickettsiaceae bacterium H1]|nr:Mrp/NBP35 family ATP-binding protein [Rickettsiaceae bacterium H1]
MKLSENQVLKILRKIIDPITKTNIVDAGMVSRVIIDEYNGIKFSLEIDEDTLEERKCLAKECKTILESVFDVNKVIVAITNKSKIAKKIITVASGKGGVGKSTVALNIAVGLAEKGFNVAIVDADIYGPSIPHMLGITGKPKIVNNKIIPFEKYGVKSISIGYFLREGNSVIWRGPMLTKSLQQMIVGTLWENLDYMIIDTPPGTGDVHISLAKMCKIFSALIVSTPQKLANIDALKAIDMFTKLKIPVSGVIENMSYLPEIEEKFLFGRNGGKKLAERCSVKFLGEIPIDSNISSDSDKGIPAIFNEKVKSYFSRILRSIM